MDPDRESSTSLIDAAFIKLTSDNDEKTERTGKSNSDFLHTKSQGKKKEEQHAKKKKKEGRRNEERSQV